LTTLEVKLTLTLFVSIEFVKRETSKREEEKDSISIVWNEKKLGRERQFLWDPHLFVVFAEQQRNGTEMLIFNKIAGCRYS
jgi:Trm5-related predicted tRNA methylase